MTFKGHCAWRWCNVGVIGELWRRVEGNWGSLILGRLVGGGLLVGYRSVKGVLGVVFGIWFVGV